MLEYAAPLELFIMVFKAQGAEIFQHRSQACARQVRILLKAISLRLVVKAKRFITERAINPKSLS